MSNSKTFANWPASRFSTAPMLDLTDRHCRYFHRLMTKEALLYTEMVTTGAIIYGRGNYLDYNKEEHPLALQLGGSDPSDLAFCAKLAAERGYDEINLNVGCPSDRVQNGMFGACLMAHAPLVAQCVSAMRDKVDIPVSVKTRIGIDEHDSYEFLTNFIETVHNESGCTDFIIHARKAWLKGLSPKENRDIPPLNYPRAYKVKQDFPNLNISVNGGIKTIAEANSHLQHLDGVMLGREIYQNPYILATVDRDIFNKETKILSRHAIVEAMFPYIEKQLSYGVPLGHMSRHILGIFQGQQGAKAWRRYISENAFKKEAGVHTIKDALKFVNDN